MSKRKPKEEDGTALMEEASIRIALLEDALAQSNRAIQFHKKETDEARNLIDELAKYMAISSKPTKCYVLTLEDVARIHNECKNRTTRELWDRFIGRVK